MRRTMALVAVAGLLLLDAAPARAEHYCRERARDLNERVIHLESREEAVGAFRDALGADPECETEFRTLGDWYGSGEEFPFPKADDPKHGFLGPIGWWWNTVYVDIFNRDTALMFFLGWELFLLPLGLIMFAVALLGLGIEVLTGRRTDPTT